MTRWYVFHYVFISIGFRHNRKNIFPSFGQQQLQLRSVKYFFFQIEIFIKKFWEILKKIFSLSIEFITICFSYIIYFTIFNRIYLSAKKFFQLFWVNRLTWPFRFEYFSSSAKKLIFVNKYLVYLFNLFSRKISRIFPYVFEKRIFTSDLFVVQNNFIF